MISPLADILHLSTPYRFGLDLVIMRGATCEVLHVEGFKRGLLCALPFYTALIRTLVTVQHTALRVCHSPAKLLGLEYNLAHVFIKTVPIYPIERHQCHGVLGPHGLPACFLKHVEGKTGQCELKSCHQRLPLLNFAWASHALSIARITTRRRTIHQACKRGRQSALNNRRSR